MRLAAPSVIALSLFLAACGESEAPPVASLDFQKQLQTQLIKAKPGEVIEIPAGTGGSSERIPPPPIPR